MSAKRSVKAQKAHGVYINGRLEQLQINPTPGDEWPLVPVFVLPADAASYDAMVELGAKAIHDHMAKQAAAFLPPMQAKSWGYLKGISKSGAQLRIDQATAVLSALGIVRPAKTRK